MTRRLRFLLVSAISLFTTVIACSGGGDTGAVVPPPTPTISVSASASIVSASTAAPGVLNISVTRGGGYTGAVGLSVDGLPTGVTASFNPASLPNGTTVSVLTLTAGATAVAATNNITIRVTGSGVTDATTTPVALTVTSVAAPDYTLSAAPATLTVTAGASGTSSISINRTGAFAGDITLALTGNPVGVTGTFAPNPATGTASTLSIVTTAATVPGTYALTVTGTATGIASRTTTVSLTVNAAPAVTVALTPATLSIVAGATGQTAVTITRVGGLTGDVTVTAEGLPVGVTQGALAITGTTGSATFTATTAAVPGTYNVTVRGTSGAISGTASLTLTITAAPSIALVVGPPSSVSVVQGATGTLVANITRNGGFAGTVNLAVTGLPAGVTTTITPAAATGATASISLAVGSGVAVGTYPATLTGTATGLTNATAAFTLIVTAASNGGNIVFQFCSADAPLFFAIEDGTGPWTRVLPGANNTFTFALSQSIGGVTYVSQNGASITTTVLLRAKSEFVALSGQTTCPSATTGRTVTGTVANVGPTEQAAVSLGSSVASTSFGVTNFTLQNVPDGSLDLIASRAAFGAAGFTPNKLIIRRALTQATGSVLPVLDFNASDAFAPQTAAVTIGNLGSDIASVNAGFFTTTGGSTSIGTSTSATTVYGVPSGKMIASDLHFITASGTDGVSSIRTASMYAHDLTDRTVTLGAVLILPNVTNIGTTTFRPRAQGTLQVEYNTMLTAAFSQSATNRSMTITASSGYFGGATTYDLTVPDLFEIGYVTSWAPNSVGAISFFLQATGGTGNAAEGSFVKSATRYGTAAIPGIRR